MFPLCCQLFNLLVLEFRLGCLGEVYIIEIYRDLCVFACTFVTCSLNVIDCLVCGLLITGILVYVAYRHLLSSSSETEVSRSEYKVARKEEKPPAEADTADQKLTQKKMSKEFDPDVIPAEVLKQIGDITVLKKTATFNVGGRVSFVQDIYSLQVCPVCFMGFCLIQIN